MKTDLLKEFFERDLTDSEEEQLSKQLSESTKNSMKFAKHAKSFYIKTGLPNPAPHVGHLGHLGHLGHVIGSSMTLKVIGGLIAGGALVATMHVVSKPAVQTIPTPVPTVISIPTNVPTIGVKTVTPAAPKPTPPQTQPTTFKAPQTPNMVKPIAYDPRIKYEGLDLIVERQTAGLVTIRVLDETKKEVRLLFAGLLNKGKWTFQWDGKLSNNDYAQPGTYQIQVQSGREVLAKEITLKSEATASKK